MAGYKDWSSGDNPSGLEFDELLMGQVISRFADETTRDLAKETDGSGGVGVPGVADPPNTPSNGMVTMTIDTGTLWVYNEAEEQHIHLARWKAWGTYTPALDATTTPPTLGTGSTQFGRWFREGTHATVAIFLRFGSSGSAPGTGIYEISLPTECPVQSDWFGAIEVIGGNGLAIDSSTNAREPVAIKFVDANTIRLEAGGLTGPVTESNLIAWDDDDIVLSALFNYETEEAMP